MTSELNQGRSGIIGAASLLITGWAILGGFLLLAVIVMNVISVLGGIFWKPFPGDFELTQIGVAVAVFSFLPYCELTGSHVTADIFTARARPWTISFFKLLASIVALVFSIILLWRMYEGLGNQKEYDYTTAILLFPIWKAFVPILMSLALMIVAGAITLIEHAREVSGGVSHG